MSVPAQSIAYLISRYPAFSHTFIEREIEELRSQGFSIEIASINEPDDISGQDLSTIFYVKRQGFFRAILAVLATFIFHPFNFFKTLFLVFKLAAFDLKALLYHFFYLGEAALVGRWMNQKKINHLHVHFANPASTVAFFVSTLYPISFSMTVHGPDEFYDVSFNKLTQKFVAAKFICCIGKYARSQIMRIIPSKEWSKIHITPLGVDTNQYTQINLRESPQHFNIISIGRLTRNKGQQILLDALALLAEKKLPIHLYLIGDGPDRQSLMNSVKELKIDRFVTFKGSLNQIEVKKLLSESDLFVLPSFAEGIPVALMEAMAMGLPCIATMINGIPELITNEENGILVFPSDVKELEKQINELYHNKNKRIELGKKARERILAKWQLSDNVRKLAEVFRKDG